MNSSAESIPANMSNVTTSYYHPQQNQQFLTNFNNPTNNQTLNNTTMTNDLPKQFVSSLRILFDILDENHSGFVRLSDIESRWKEDGVKGLPSGVVDALKRVTPANGYLNFDRFVAGLKLVLWRSKHGNMVSGDGVGDISIARLDESQEPGKENQLVYNIDDDEEEDDVKPVVNMGLQSAAQHQFNHFSDQIPNNTPDGQFITNNIKQSNISSSTNLFGNNSGAIPNSTNLASYGPRSRPNYPQTNFGYQNTPDYASTSTHTGNGYPRSNHPNTSFSLPNNTDPSRVLNNDCLPSSSGSALPGDKLTPQQMQQHQRLPYVTRCPERPPLQPRQPHGHHYNNMPPVLPDRHQSSGDTSGAAILQRPFSPPIVPPRDQNKANILNELKNWQRQRMKNLPSADPLNARHAPSHSEWGFNNRNPNTDNTKEVDNKNKNNYVNIDSFQQRRNPEEYGAKKSSELRHSSRRWDGRRHTLTSGVDHSMIKRMRQLEEEKEMLVQGMEVVESARLWYQKRLALINDKQKLAAWSSFNDSSLEASQERMNFQKTRISEVNQQLKTLIESSERGFPLHMNLAIGNTGHPLVLEDNSVKMLKEQNKQLTEEISTKCDKITQLEQEKTALIRELFESRSRNKPSLDDTTFM